MSILDRSHEALKSIESIHIYFVEDACRLEPLLKPQFISDDPANANHSPITLSPRTPTSRLLSSAVLKKSSLLKSKPSRLMLGSIVTPSSTHRSYQIVSTASISATPPMQYSLEQRKTSNGSSQVTLMPHHITTQSLLLTPPLPRSDPEVVGLMLCLPALPSV